MKWLICSGDVIVKRASFKRERTRQTETDDLLAQHALAHRWCAECGRKQQDPPDICACHSSALDALTRFWLSSTVLRVFPCELKILWPLWKSQATQVLRESRGK